jgi:hypothetical protein
LRGAAGTHANANANSDGYGNTYTDAVTHATSYTYTKNSSDTEGATDAGAAAVVRPSE